MTTTNWKAPNNATLVTVDLTYDFLPPNGALMVENGNEVLPVINELATHFNQRVWTKEEHDPQHDFFASSHKGKKPLDTVDTNFGTQFLWPDHCVKGTQGTEFHESLDVRPEDLVVIKGTDSSIHAYSAVYMDDRKTIIRYEDGKTLPEKMRERGIDTAVVEGLAYDFCAGMTAYDLAKEGFKVYFVRDASRSIEIPTQDGRTTIDDMDDMLAEAGVIVVNSNELQQRLAPTLGNNLG